MAYGLLAALELRIGRLAEALPHAERALAVMTKFSPTIVYNLEAYAAVSRIVGESKGEGTREAWLKRAQEAQREELLTGEAVFPEGVCAVAAGNALELLLRDGIITADGNPLRAETAFHRGPQFDALEPLRERLAAGRDTR